MLGVVDGGLGITSSGKSSGFFTKTYTNVFSSSGNWTGIVGSVGVATDGALIKTYNKKNSWFLNDISLINVVFDKLLRFCNAFEVVLQ